MVTGAEWSWVAAAYGLGCCTAGYYWVRWRTGLDLRQQGSGTVGARNAGRVLGASGFVVTFLLDFAKGALAVAGARCLGFSSLTQVLAMWAVVVGHNWPVQLRFQGGKGIAAALGALVAYDPALPVIVGAIFLPSWALLRSLTLGGLLAFGLAPLGVFALGLGNEPTAAMSGVATLLVVSHRRNIRAELAQLLSRGSVQDGLGSTDRNLKD
jgi:glycerol-3-phosphate acyltransferase PlsY